MSNKSKNNQKPDTEKDSLIAKQIAIPEFIPHKMMFFFMPDTIVFEQEAQNESEENKYLLEITPYLYWCSAHDFTEVAKTSKSPDKKYLFQYQIYSVNNKGIEESETKMFWFQHRNEITAKLIDFIDRWKTHKRRLVDPYEVADRYAKTSLNPDNFMFFSVAAGYTLGSFRDLYVSNCNEGDFDTLQLKFWRTMACLNYDNIHNKKLALDDKLTDNTIKKRGRPKKITK